MTRRKKAQDSGCRRKTHCATVSFVSTDNDLGMKASFWAILIVLSLFWGGSFIFIELALETLPPLTLVFARVAIASLALYSYLRLTGQRLPTDKKLWTGFVILGLFANLLPFLLITIGQQHIEAGLASILNATMPIFTVLLAHWLTKDERISAGKFLGVLLGLAGVAVLIGIESLQGLSSNLLSQLAVMGAAICYACATIYGKRFSHIPAAQTATGSLIAATAMLLIPTLLLDQPWLLQPDTKSMAALVALALISTAMAYLFYYYILTKAGATYASLVTLLIPPSAILLGAIFLNEQLKPSHFLGLTLIMLGLLSIDGRVAKLLKRERATRV